jgi:hypothetical protein
MNAINVFLFVLIFVTGNCKSREKQTELLNAVPTNSNQFEILLICNSAEKPGYFNSFAKQENQLTIEHCNSQLICSKEIFYLERFVNSVPPSARITESCAQGENSIKIWENLFANINGAMFRMNSHADSEKSTPLVP